MNNHQLAIKVVEAADYIAKHGLCQGSLWDSAGRVCVRGAFMKVDVEFSGRDEMAIHHEFRAAIMAHDPDPRFSPYCTNHYTLSEYLHYLELNGMSVNDVSFCVAWNNARDRSAEDVVLMLKHTAAALEDLWAPTTNR